jgi:hypothetical protein
MVLTQESSVGSVVQLPSEGHVASGWSVFQGLRITTIPPSSLPLRSGYRADYPGSRASEKDPQ